MANHQGKDTSPCRLVFYVRETTAAQNKEVNTLDVRE